MIEWKTNEVYVMRKVRLFIAMSLDGFIADQNRGIDWLHGEDVNQEDNQSYDEFIKDIDTIIMGWKTYHQIVEELSKDSWVYPNQKTYVMTHKEMKDKANIIFSNDKINELVEALKKEDGKDIWICGGGNIIGQLVRFDLIDEYYVSVIPTLLGDGISLFGYFEKEKRLKLTKTCTYNGIVDLVYERVR